MNRIAEILAEVTQIKEKQGKLQNDFKELEARKAVLVKEWQSLCSHPIEYINDDGICEACRYQVVEEAE